jgi:integrase
LNIGASGKKTWYVYYRDARGKANNHKLGGADALTVAMARQKANSFKAKLIGGEEPQKKTVEKTTLRDYLDKVYEPWVTVERKDGAATMQTIRSAFGFLLDTPVDELDLNEYEKWRIERRKSGTKAATINRLNTALQSAINWGVKHKCFASNPLKGLEHLKEHDSEAIVRYLSPEERARLLAALDAREEEIRGASGKRAGVYADYFKPMVLLALNTGVRRGNLFSLVWDDIDFNNRTFTLRAASSKSGKTNRLPLNSAAFDVLSAWRAQSKSKTGKALVFPSPKTGTLLNHVQKEWASVMRDADIEKFRWHDMRHDFASQLVRGGVDLNTVRELLGHTDMKMTMRYAHLAPDLKAKAVKKLEELYQK